MPDGMAEPAPPRTASPQAELPPLAARTASGRRLLRGRSDDRVRDLGSGGESLERLGSQLQADQSHASAPAALAQRRPGCGQERAAKRSECRNSRARSIAPATRSWTSCSTNAPSTSTPRAAWSTKKARPRAPCSAWPTGCISIAAKEPGPTSPIFTPFFLLFLALSGLFMIPGRKGLLGRGAIVLLLGAAVPIAYVVLSGGP